MDDIPQNPAFHSLPAVVEHGPAPSSTSSQPARPKVPRAILETITQLGLRYEPSGQAADLQSHAARVGLLAQDCADLNPLKLRHAAVRWAKFKPFMPKASELHAIIEDMDSAEWREEHRGEALQMFCDEKNEWAKRIGADWWWRVVTIDRGGEPVRTTEKIEGWRAVEERNKADSRRTEWFRPSEGEAAAIHRFNAECIKRDMTAEESASLFRRKTRDWPAFMAQFA